MKKILCALLCFFTLMSNIALGQTQEEMAKELANPIASLISVPFQNNFHFGTGDKNGFKYTLNMQPVVPISLGDNWNLISRTIVPIVYQNDIVGNTSQSGVGDLVQSLFFSPKKPTEKGLIWGAGPVFLIPTASDASIGLEKLGVGPTAVALKISGQYTYGMLVNHIISVAGDDARSDLNASFFQPFVARMMGKGLSLSLGSENTYSWNHEAFSGMTGIYANQVLNFGKQMVQLGGGPKILYGKNSPTNIGFRINVILLFPK